MSQNFPFYSLPKVYDAHVITSDYLIENIDLAFDEWKNRPWNKTLGFDDFCEYILPYRIADDRKKGKVYRNSFGERRDIEKQIETDEEVPLLFKNRYVEDVTNQYFGENEVTIPLQAKAGKYLYLGVFNPNGWIPIDIASREGDKVIFRNLEPDIIYQVFYLDKNKQIPVAYPFIYTRGEAVVLKPDCNRMEDALLKRKMSLKKPIAAWLYQSVLEARIEASQDASFTHPDLLCQFNDTLWGNYFEFPVLKKGKKYRYLRYVILPGKRMELAELSIYEDSLCRQPISLRCMSSIEPRHELGRITDGDVLSFFRAAETTSNTLVYDLGKSTSVNRIVFSPRNDDNYIWPSNVYELFYHDGINGWKSLGRQTATGRELNYRVPYNALLWLRNLTKGREEQVFIYRNGKQVFTYDL